MKNRNAAELAHHLVTKKQLTVSGLATRHQQRQVAVRIEQVFQVRVTFDPGLLVQVFVRLRVEAGVEQLDEAGLLH